MTIEEEIANEFSELQDWNDPNLTNSIGRVMSSVGKGVNKQKFGSGYSFIQTPILPTKIYNDRTRMSKNVKRNKVKKIKIHPAVGWLIWG